MPPAKNLGFSWNGQSIPTSKGKEWMRADPKAAQAESTRRFLEDRQQTRQEKLSDTMGLGTIATGMDIAGGVPQYLAGEALGSMGLDPGSLVMSASEKTGINPLYLAAGGAAFFGANKMRHALGDLKLEKQKGLLGKVLDQPVGPPGRDYGLLDQITAEHMAKRAAHDPYGIKMNDIIAATNKPSKLVRPPSERTLSLDDYTARTGRPVPTEMRNSIEGMKVKDLETGKDVPRFTAGDRVGSDVLDPATLNRERLLQEPSTLPTSRKLSEMTPREIQAFGKEHGVDWKANKMVLVRDKGTGLLWPIPGGFKKPFTYVDLHQLKHAGIDPEKLSPQFHDRLHRHMTESMSPKTLSDDHVFQGLMFGLASPNVPLHDTQMILTRIRPKSEADWEKLGSYTRGKGDLSNDERLALSQQMMADYGLNAGFKGGSGNASTNDLTRIADLANVFRDNPGFYRQRPGESIRELADRMSNSVPGLNTKTADMGTVWQSILDADAAPMDRHMADLYLPVLEKNKRLGASFKQETVDAWNKEIQKEIEKGTVPTRKPVKSYKTLTRLDPDYAPNRLRDTINARPQMQSRLKDGTPNPEVPPHLRNLPHDPKEIYTRGEQYEGALDQNAELAKQSRMSLYQKQWQVWDRQRRQINPHESMHPDLHKVPKMSWGDMHRANLFLRDQGFAQTGKPVKRGDWRKGFYYGVPAAVGAGGLLGQRREEDRRE